jgi:hypothetical protein
MYAYQWWADTTTGLLKQRNSANSAWVTIGTLASTNLGLLPVAGGTMTGVLAVTAGTAALPGIAVSGDLNTGVFSPGADTLALVTAGTNRLHVTSAGLVGIGVTDPGSWNANYNGPMAVIGSTSNSACGLVLLSSTAGSSRLDFSDGTGGFGQAPGSVVYNHSSNSLAFTTDNSERARIDSSGNLSFNSGYGSAAVAYGCRAWVNFNGTGTVAIRGSGNVSSITDNGTGDYTVNFTTALADANYSFLAGAQANGIANGPMVDLFANGATGSARFRVFTQASAAMDSPVCTFMAIR